MWNKLDASALELKFADLVMDTSLTIADVERWHEGDECWTKVTWETGATSVFNSNGDELFCVLRKVPS